MTIHDADEYVPAPGEWGDSPTVSEPRLLKSHYIEGEPFWFLHEHNDGERVRHDITDLCKELRVIPAAEAAQPIDVMCDCGHGLRDHYGTSDGDRLPQPCAVCKCDDFVETEGEGDSPTVSEPRTPIVVDGDRIRWLFDNYGFGAGRDCEPPDDDQLADFIEDLRDSFARERAEAAQPIDVDIQRERLAIATRARDIVAEYNDQQMSPTRRYSEVWSALNTFVDFHAAEYARLGTSETE